MSEYSSLIGSGSINRISDPDFRQDLTTLYGLSEPMISAHELECQGAKDVLHPVAHLVRIEEGTFPVVQLRGSGEELLDNGGFMLRLAWLRPSRVAARSRGSRALERLSDLDARASRLLEEF
jgi:hypothetical protein